MTIVITVPGVALLSVTPDLLAYMGQPPEALPHAAAYMATLKWSLPPAIAFAVIRNFVSALNRPMSAMWVMYSPLTTMPQRITPRRMKSSTT